MLPKPKDQRKGVGAAIDDAALARLARTVVATLSLAPDGVLLSANTNLLRLLGVNSLSTLTQRDFKTEILADPADWQFWERAKSQRRTVVDRLELRSADGRQVVLKGDIWYVRGHNKGVDHFFCAFADLLRSPQVGTTVRRAAAQLDLGLEPMQTGTETVLLLSENAQLSANVRSSLEGLGYKVLMSSLLEEGRDRPSRPGCDLVVVDSAVSDGAGSIQIFTPGYTDEPPYGITLARPFTLHELAATLRRALDDSTDG